MALFARLLGRWRAHVTRAWIPRGAAVLNFGSVPVASAAFADASFDVVVLLDLLQNIQAKDALGWECSRLLRSGGRLIVLVPARRAADFDPLTTPRLFARPGLILEFWQPLQLGSHYLFVLRKSAEAGLAPVATRTPAEDVVYVAA